MSRGEARLSAEQVTAWLVVGACALFVLWQLYPEDIFSDTTPVQGDLGGHLLEPAHLRDHLLPRFRLSGWSQDWFAGFPILAFYFPLPPFAVVLLDVVLPYNVAFKSVAALGPPALPVAAYLFARLHERTRLSAAVYAAAAVAVVLQPLLDLVGGSIASAAVGEYSYGLSLAFGVVALGLAGKGLRTGGHRVATAVLLVLCVVSHIIPAITVAGGVVVLTLMRPSRRRLWWTATTGAIAAALAGVWLVPLLLRSGYTSGPIYSRVDKVSAYLFPEEFAPVLIVAAVGLGLVVFVIAVGERTRRYDMEVFLAVMAFVSAAAVVLLGDGRIQHLRFLSGWYLWTALLAAASLSRLAELIDEKRVTASRGRPVERPMAARLAMPVVVLMAVIPAWDTRLGKGVLTGGKGDLTSYAQFFMKGYEATERRAEYQEYVDTLRRVGRVNGCGRALAEWNQGTWSDLRVSLVDLTPYWTDGCITTTSGLLLQSSATSPYLGYTTERLSREAISLRRRSEDKHDFDLAAGVADLRLLGVKYYLASDPAAQAAADASADLRLVASTQPYEEMHWNVYEVSDVHVVESPPFQPVVARSMDERTITAWYDAADRTVMPAADGPKAWPRVDARSSPPRVPVPATAVSNVRIEHHRISFDVADTGRPVVVKVSYFPNWKADGADGPWRVAPNFMVVVPRSNTVVLHYGRTLPDYAGVVATLAGIGAAGLVARRPPLEMPVEAVVEPTPTRRPARPKAKRKKKG